MNTWVNIDKNQFLLKKSEKEFDVISIAIFNNSKYLNKPKYWLCYSNVNLAEYPEYHIEELVREYGYENIVAFRKKNTINSNEVLAVIISKKYFMADLVKVVDTDSEINEWLESFGIGMEYRICSECGELMNEGYCIEDGIEYYCSDSCLEKNVTKAEYLELYDDGEGDSYWTQWY